MHTVDGVVGTGGDISEQTHSLSLLCASDFQLWNFNQNSYYFIVFSASSLSPSHSFLLIAIILYTTRYCIVRGTLAQRRCDATLHVSSIAAVALLLCFWPEDASSSSSFSSFLLSNCLFALCAKCYVCPLHFHTHNGLWIRRRHEEHSQWVMVSAPHSHALIRSFVSTIFHSISFEWVDESGTSTLRYTFHFHTHRTRVRLVIFAAAIVIACRFVISAARLFSFIFIYDRVLLNFFAFILFVFFLSSSPLLRRPGCLGVAVFDTVDCCICSTTKSSIFHFYFCHSFGA